MNAYIKLIRPKHWIKNVLIFVPLFYAYNLTNLRYLYMTILCFISFCLISSVAYIINDIADLDRDKQHPVKCKRPIAAGMITVPKAIILAIILAITGFLLATFGYGNYFVALYTASYFLLNLAYSFFLKHQPVIDCFAIAAGFILRIYAGASASASPVSEWLFLTIIAVSLFFAFGKRRGEMMQISDTNKTRSVLSSYSLSFMNGIVFMCAGLSVVFYAIWALANFRQMIYSVPLVIFIICKYLMIINDEKASGDPVTTVLGDKELLAAVLVFGVLSMILLYL